MPPVNARSPEMCGCPGTIHHTADVHVLRGTSQPSMDADEGKRIATPQTCIRTSLVVKNLPANARDMGSIPGLGRSPGGGNGSPLQ